MLGNVPRDVFGRKPGKAAAPKKAKAVKKRAASAMKGINTYDSKLSDQQIAAGKHRQHVGGAWEEIGELQFNFLVAQGLKPQHRFLDVGCGAMRGGIHFAAYVDPGNYYGIDVNDRLLEAARRVEIPAAGLADRVPDSNLRETARFDADFGVGFDYAIAVSVFTHLPLNYIRLCLYQVAKVMNPGGRFYATLFTVPDNLPYDADYQQVQVTSRPERDPFHYRPSELEWAAGVADWDFTYIGDWGHSRGQKMAEFRRKA
jgi:SAM-dependent methyltransferase